MSNPNPYQGRLGRARARKPGNLVDAQRVLWRAIRVAEQLMDEADRREHREPATAQEPDEVRAQRRAEREIQIKCIHAITQATASYARLLEIGEQEQRLTAVEAQLAALGARR